MKREREEEYRRDVKATAAARLAVIDKNRLLLSDDPCRQQAPFDSNAAASR